MFRYNPYTVLGIRVGSNAAVVRRAILQKLKIHHPDRGGSHSEATYNKNTLFLVFMLCY